MNNKFEELNRRLNIFVNKYYMNKIIRGALIVPFFFILIVLFVSALEYFGWFSINIRFFILLFTIGSVLYFFLTYLFIPFLRYFNIANRLSNKHVNSILVNHFPNIQDTIINVIELNELASLNNELIISSIDQKINRLSSFDFNSAISYANSFKLLKYLGLAFLALIATLIFQPKIFTEGTTRIFKYNTEFTKDIGVIINIDTANLSVQRGEDLEINIDLIGDKQFDNLFIVYGGREYLLEHVGINKYKYLFKHVNNNFQFLLTNDFIKSKYYKISVIDIPILQNYFVDLQYPKYLNKDNATVHNINNISIPYGTILNWSFNSIYCDNILIQNSDTILDSNRNGNEFTFNYIAYENQQFNLQLVNNYTSINTDLSLTVQVIRDLYPSIDVDYVKDENNFRLFYFKGKISDDYGFHILEVYDGVNNTGVKIPINKNITEQEFYYAYEFPVEHPTNRIYFKIFDNDILNGYKFTKSEVISIVIPNINDIVKYQKREFKKLEDKLDKSLLLANELKRDISEIKKSIINENLETWEKEAKLKSIADKHNQLNKLVNELSKKNKEKDIYINSFTENSEDILEKQKQIQELLDNLLSEDIKILIEELNKLANDFNEDELNKLTDDLELNYDDLSKELDKNLELLKRFEIEENIDNQIKKIRELSKQQKEISKDIQQKNLTPDSLVGENRKHLEHLKEIKNDYNKIIEKNTELEKPLNLSDFNKELDTISNNISNNEEEISNKKGEKDADTNSKDLNKLADKMQSMMNSHQQRKAGEDSEALRQLLDNLFTFSFEQESSMKELLHVRNNNPRFIDLIKVQSKLTDDYIIIRDSLYALSKRNPTLGFHISKAAFSIESDLIKIKELFEKRNSGLVRKKQREILTASNDMILLLTESLKNMDSMGSGGGSGNKKKKPKKGNKPSMNDMKQGQESFKKQLENMLTQMKGNNGNAGKNGMKQMGKMLAQQEILQKMMNELLNNGGVGSKATEKLKEIKKLMDANKRDLVNMNLNNSTLYRQQQILTRLLEAETADMERDKDEKRESKQATNYKRSNPMHLFEDNNENINFNEIFNTKTVNLFDFYKYKYQEYLIKVNSNKNEKRN